jgi:16S rRNA (cytosine967-C5)-methyltransferase
VLRRRAYERLADGSHTPRARVLGMLRLERGMTTEAISNLCHGERFAPEPLSEAERSALTSRTLDDAPPHDRRRLSGMAGRAAGSSVRRRPRGGSHRDGEPGAAGSRVNTLKAKREKVLASLRASRRRATPWSPIGLAHRTRRRRAQIPAFMRGGLSSRARRGAGRGLAAAALFSAAKPASR